MGLGDRRAFRFVVHDRAGHFIESFDAALASTEGIR